VSRRFIDVDNRILREQGSGGLAVAVTELRVGYLDDSTLDLGFVYSGGVSGDGNIDLGTGVTPDVQLIVKPKTGDQRFDGAVTLKNVSFPRTSIGGLYFYSGDTAISNAAIDTAMGVGAPTDTESIEFVGQFRYLINGKRQTTRTFPFWIDNTLDRDDVPPAPTASTRVRSGTPAIPSGQSYIDIVFATVMPDATWVARNFTIRNTTDSTPLNLIVGLMTAKTAAGCRLQLSAATDSANYHLDYVCDQS
jgi:hypothetical protein